MSETPAQSPEPTLADVMAYLTQFRADVHTALTANAAVVDALATDVAVIKASQTKAQFTAAQNAADVSVLRDSQAGTHAAVKGGFDNVRRDFDRLREDIAGVKSDTAFVEGYVNDMHEAVRRHIADPNSHRDAA